MPRFNKMSKNLGVQQRPKSVVEGMGDALSEVGEGLAFPNAALRQGIYSAQEGRAPTQEEMMQILMDSSAAPSGADIAERTGLDDDNVLGKTAIATSSEFLDPTDVLPLGMLTKAKNALKNSRRFKNLFGKPEVDEKTAFKQFKNLLEERMSKGEFIDPDLSPGNVKYGTFRPGENTIVSDDYLKYDNTPLKTDAEFADSLRRQQQRLDDKARNQEILEKAKKQAEELRRKRLMGENTDPTFPGN
jgi:hypothetical protein